MKNLFFDFRADGPTLTPEEAQLVSILFADYAINFRNRMIDAIYVNSKDGVANATLILYCGVSIEINSIDNKPKYGVDQHEDGLLDYFENPQLALAVAPY